VSLLPFEAKESKFRTQEMWFFRNMVFTDKLDLPNKLSLVHNHYVRNSNRRHRFETCPHAIISDLVKWDVPTSPRRAPSSVEGKKETHGFLACLSLFNIRDVPVFMTKGRHTLLRCVFNYTSKGKHAILGVRLLLARKAGASPFPYKGRRALECRVYV
jgi:hypothetical protein